MFDLVFLVGAWLAIMTQANADHLSNTLEVSARLDESGLSAKAKSRFLSACDRLLGGILDVPAAKLEGRASLTRANNVVKQRLIEAEGDAAVARLLADPNAGERLVLGILQDASRKQINREAVAFEAKQELLRLPAPDPKEDPDTENSLEDDWLNIFSRYAEDASSERLRQMWGRILAGEVRKPGSFSPITLRTISEIDRHTAELFQKIMVRRFKGGYILKPENLKGEELFNYIGLEELGLLQEVNGTINFSITIPENGVATVLNGRMLLEIKSDPGKKARVDIVKITRVGMEISSIFPAESDDVPLRALAERLKNSFSEISLCHINKSESDGVIYYSRFEKIK